MCGGTRLEDIERLRKNISKMRGEHVLFDEIRYFFYITTRTELSLSEVVRCANERCDQENVIEQLKNGVNALRVPLYDLVSNWAYMVMAALAWNLKSWSAMMMHLKRDRREYIGMEFRRLLHSLIGYQPSLDRLFSARRLRRSLLPAPARTATPWRPAPRNSRFPVPMRRCRNSGSFHDPKSDPLSIRRYRTTATRLF